MKEIDYAFGKMILNTNNIVIVQNGYEQGRYVLYVDSNTIPFDNEKQRSEAYDLILCKPS